MALQLRATLRQPMPHNRLVHQRLPKRLSLQTILERCTYRHARKTVHTNTDGESLVIEVLHHIFHAHALLPYQIFDRHENVVELYEGRSRGCLALYFYTPHVHTLCV
jgi:hypothetical protein